MLLEVVFWASVALLVYAHVGYPLLLRALVAVRGSRPAAVGAAELPAVSLIVAAHNEEAVIERKVRDALALDYPRSKLELIVASDGSTDRTAELAREAGADLVLELPRGGEGAALNAPRERASGGGGALSGADNLLGPHS